MCGRTCLTLEPGEVLCACKYKSSKNAAHAELPSNAASPSESAGRKGSCNSTVDAVGSFIMPEWRPEFNCGRKYTPSYNLAPTDITPVLVSADHFSEAEADTAAQSRIVVPMMWGMIPFWHKGDYRRHGLTTNNCRLEHMLESKLYSGPFRRGQRCAILCEGFYEWQTTKSAKPSERAAHLLYMPQVKGIKIYDRTTWTPESVKLLKLAGLFDVWEDENGDKMYSYSIITFESSKLLSWLHHRMPAILETEQQVTNWLDYKRVPDEEALAVLCPARQLEWHRVSSLVNNSRNKSDLCNKPLELVQATRSPKNKSLMKWLNVRKRREAHANQLSDDENEDGGHGNGTGGGTSESDGENPPKRPRFRDFKKAVKAAAQLSAVSTDSASEKPQTCDES